MWTSVVGSEYGFGSRNIPTANEPRKPAIVPVSVFSWTEFCFVELLTDGLIIHLEKKKTRPTPEDVSRPIHLLVKYLQSTILKIYPIGETGARWNTNFIFENI